MPSKLALYWDDDRRAAVMVAIASDAAMITGLPYVPVDPEARDAAFRRVNRRFAIGQCILEVRGMGDDLKALNTITKGVALASEIRARVPVRS